jgi:hypothetical protein
VISTEEITNTLCGMWPFDALRLSVEKGSQTLQRLVHAMYNLNDEYIQEVEN